MNPITSRPGANHVDPSTLRQAAATEHTELTASAHRELIAKIQRIDGRSQQQAEDAIKAFEVAFRAL